LRDRQTMSVPFLTLFTIGFVIVVIDLQVGAGTGDCYSDQKDARPNNTQ
jgi:hypothetical protein